MTDKKIDDQREEYPVVSIHDAKIQNTPVYHENAFREYLSGFLDEVALHAKKFVGEKPLRVNLVSEHGARYPHGLFVDTDEGQRIFALDFRAIKSQASPKETYRVNSFDLFVGVPDYPDSPFRSVKLGGPGLSFFDRAELFESIESVMNERKYFIPKLQPVAATTQTQPERPEVPWDDLIMPTTLKQ